VARKGELAQIAELAANRRLKIPIATVLPLSEARQAQQLSQSGHTQGKIILRVGEG
jgi:NADPH:quinone reductase-like Zn-dependent oxidoreductase